MMFLSFSSGREKIERTWRSDVVPNHLVVVVHIMTPNDYKIFGGAKAYSTTNRVTPRFRMKERIGIIFTVAVKTDV